MNKNLFISDSYNIYMLLALLHVPLELKYLEWGNSKETLNKYFLELAISRIYIKVEIPLETDIVIILTLL